MRLVSISRVNLAYKWWVTIAVTLGMIMSIMDMTIVNVAIPQMQRTFGARLQDVQWVMTIYMLTQAMVIPLAPYLTMKWGGKRAYIWMLSAFLGGSLLCGLAWNLPSLILFRFIQGIGGGILLPLVMSLQYQAFPVEERGKAASVMAIPLTIAPLSGPILGGYLVTNFGWQWAFFINIPLGIIAVALAQKVLRPTAPEQQTHFDGAGFLTAAAGCAAFVYGIATDTVLSICAGALLLLIFALVERRQTQRGLQPLLDLRCFQDRTFTFSVLALIFFSMVFFGLLLLIPIYLQTLHQETAFQAGTIQTAQALATLALLPIIGRCSDKVGPRLIALVGLLVLLVTTLLMMTLALDTALWIVVGILVLLGCASGMSQQIPVAAMSRIKHEDHKAVANGSTLVTVLRAVAAPTGVALLSNIDQLQSQQATVSLARQGLTGELLSRQSALLAMHDSFLVAAALTIVALVAITFVPRRKKHQNVQSETSLIIEEPLSQSLNAH
ncbi:MDR family MFS transporter [Dictyobacter kobayashii]|uniref:MFS transporter n=1 Tax=Dictyobacter kobayashii TaxID=2014872 RepID=A0A402AT45_9CHLR|nr:MDR family MFS transporter [Dictyobacter kobayashii]GCE22288.1 MFS transporter [Dictyobacter kobayashii]